MGAHGRLSAWANGCLEREGLARLTISILVLTTVGCLAYTWGYAEGVHNANTVIAASAPATPVLFHAGAAEVKLPLQDAAPLRLAEGSDGNDTALLHTAKRVHRRRARKAAPDDLPLLPPSDGLDAGAAGTVAGAAAAAADAGVGAMGPQTHEAAAAAAAAGAR
ncbi:hypothetical protein HT031_002150 [Scenedesmus sp. PABB004]|nr:hypothetical protein HT031_002150 [Scenedesmus sp. PABB004]